MEEEIQNEELEQEEQYIDNEETEEVETEDEVEETEVEDTQEENDEISFYDDSISKLNEANELLNSIDDYTKTVSNEDRYKYDEEEGLWQDTKTGEWYNSKPSVETTKEFDVRRFQIDQQEKHIQQLKQNLLTKTEKNMIAILDNKLGDVKNLLSDRQYETLKKDALGSISQKFAEDLLDDIDISEDYLNKLKSDCIESIEDRLSLFNLNRQEQQIINETHQTKYPMESNSPTNIQGVTGKMTWEGANKKDKKGFIDEIYSMLSGNKK